MGIELVLDISMEFGGLDGSFVGRWCCLLALFVHKNSILVDGRWPESPIKRLLVFASEDASLGHQ